MKTSIFSKRTDLNKVLLAVIATVLFLSVFLCLAGNAPVAYAEEPATTTPEDTTAQAQEIGHFVDEYVESYRSWVIYRNRIDINDLSKVVLKVIYGDGSTHIFKYFDDNNDYTDGFNFVNGVNQSFYGWIDGDSQAYCIRDNNMLISNINGRSIIWFDDDSYLPTKDYYLEYLGIKDQTIRTVSESGHPSETLTYNTPSFSFSTYSETDELRLVFDMQKLSAYYTQKYGNNTQADLSSFEKIYFKRTSNNFIGGGHFAGIFETVDKYGTVIENQMSDLVLGYIKSGQTYTFFQTTNIDTAEQKNDYENLYKCLKVSAIKATTVLPTPVKEGYTFSGWYSDAAFTTAVDLSAPITDNTTLYAKFNINEYTTYYYSDGVLNATQARSYHSTVINHIPTKTGNTFLGWYSDAELSTPFDMSTLVESDIRLYAKWQLNTYKVSFVIDGEVYASVNVAYGDNFYNDPNNIKLISSFAEAAAVTENPELQTVTSDVIVSAQFNNDILRWVKFGEFMNQYWWTVLIGAALLIAGVVIVVFVWKRS